MILNRLSSFDEKRQASEAIFELLSDFFFDKVNFISFPFTQVEDYTSTTLFKGESRLTDTAEGKFLRPDKKSRMRCQFYVKNPAAILGYVLSPVIYDSFVSLNTFDSMDIFRSYVGIKIDKGVISVAVKNHGELEKLYKTDYFFSGSGTSDTLVLEVRYNLSFTEVYIDNTYVGSFPIDLGYKTKETVTFLPLLSPAISYGGTVNITVENYQFIQDK